ncbi:hypothetical protein B0H11DRAFT_2235242 [Mycena galericulata]|nr:hypothetical protein B0H11DRAFT_2235242 [Mycena galericulata]
MLNGRFDQKSTNLGLQSISQLPGALNLTHLLPVSVNFFYIQMEDFVSNIPEAERLSLMRQIRNIRDRSTAAEATYNLRLYKPEGPGKIYVHLRGNKQVLDVLAVLPAGQPVDHVDLKLGRTDDIERRRGEYTQDCEGEEIVWCFYYETQHAKLLERLTHLTLEYMGAKCKPYPCRGCGVKHCEHFAEMAAGGLEGVAGVIEYWLRRLGENPVRVPMYNYID